MTYYINPYGGPGICYARPNLFFGGTGRRVRVDDPRDTGDIFDDFKYAGPSNIWSSKGFLTQSNDSASYDRNFPTTGADGLYFDLLIDGGDASQLTWSPVTRGGITATVTSVTANDYWIPSADRGKVVARVKLSGPRASSSRLNSNNPSPLDVPNLPQKFELVGRDSSGNEVRYGFVLKQWFVTRNRGDMRFNHISWCRSLGYRVPQVSDLTNAKCGVEDVNFPCISGIHGATPSSSGNYYQRHIGAGFFTEWGYMRGYADAGFVYSSYWTSDAAAYGFFVLSTGLVDYFSDERRGGFCVAP
ncbi:hypothetical protein [Gilliamella sp. Pas-s95]|uniref:hypothetical protein n=1 Tax=Gilliamella sp. Pas-s95 TaxID=2687317 RepID=UPI00132C8DE6|nr:hypothetical protein [Gilliamella sp. Pas-s95]MWN06798.1 hypothetical protein [Gilliamella sp. Pas-s95]